MHFSSLQFLHSAESDARHCGRHLDEVQWIVSPQQTEQDSDSPVWFAMQAMWQSDVGEPKHRTPQSCASVFSPALTIAWSAPFIQAPPSGALASLTLASIDPPARLSSGMQAGPQGLSVTH